MKVIIAGSRSFENADVSLIEDAVKASGFEVTVVISGCARGIDRLGEQWAEDNSVPVEKYKPDWSIGKHAGLDRNIDMANAGDALIAIYDGKSRGTRHMISQMRRKEKPVYVHE